MSAAYTIPAAAREYGVSADTIKRAIKAGHLKAKRTSKNADGDPVGTHLVSATALSEWFESLPDA